jgi:hypothetical protein
MDVLFTEKSTQDNEHFVGYEVGVASWDRKYGNSGACLSVRARYKTPDGYFNPASPEMGVEHVLPALAACVRSGVIRIIDGELAVDWQFAKDHGWTPKPVAA